MRRGCVCFLAREEVSGHQGQPHGTRKHSSNIGLNKKSMLALLIIVFTLNITYNVLYGDGLFRPFSASDTSGYLNVASLFGEQGIGGLISHPWPPYYWLYPIIISLFETIFGYYYIEAVLLAQIFFIFISALYIFKLTTKMFDETAGLLALVLYIATWEISRWSHFILTDGFFISMFVIALYYSFEALTARSDRAIAASLLLISVMMLLRPTAIIFAVAGVAFMAYNYFKAGKHFRYSAILLLVLLSAFFTYLALPEPESIMHPAGFWSYATESLQEGEIIPGMPEYDFPYGGDFERDPMTSQIYYYISLLGRRCFYFWSIYLAPHSTVHKVFNFLWLGPLFVASIFGIVKAFKVKHIYIYNLFLITNLISYTLFHSLLHIDYDQRYRAFLLAILIVYASYGITSLYNLHSGSLRKIPTMNRIILFCQKAKSRLVINY